MLDASSGLPLRVFVMAPSCVPRARSSRRAAPLGPDDMAGILRRDRALGVAEVMDFPSVIAGDPDVLAKVALHPHVDGHAPGVTGAALDAYAAAGIRSDHEATTWEEALEKRRRGLWVLLREASNARNLRGAARARPPPRPGVLRVLHRRPRAGHARARGPHRRDVPPGGRRRGSRPRTRCVMATLHPARCHGLADLGAIAPGFRADLVVLDDLESFRAAVVIAGGAVAARDGAALPFAAPAVPDWVRDTVRHRAARRRRVRPRPGGRARARDRAACRAADHRGGGGGADGARRPRRRRPGARPREARRDRAPPRDRARRRRARARLRPALAARSPRRSPTTRTTSSSSASTTRACAPASSGWWSSAAGSRSPTAARCAASSRCRSPGCCRRRRPRRSSSGSTSWSRCCASRA